jgi:hypothetical protein
LVEFIAIDAYSEEELENLKEFLMSCGDITFWINKILQFFII